MKAVLVVNIPDYIDDISKVELAYGLYFRKRFDGEPIDPTDILEYREVYPLKLLPEPRVMTSGVGWNAWFDGNAIGFRVPCRNNERCRMKNNIHKKATFEDRFDRKYACWVKNNRKAWHYWKKRNRKIFRLKSKNEKNN